MHPSITVAKKSIIDRYDDKSVYYDQAKLCNLEKLCSSNFYIMLNTKKLEEHLCACRINQAYFICLPCASYVNYKFKWKGEIP